MRETEAQRVTCPGSQGSFRDRNYEHLGLLTQGSFPLCCEKTVYVPGQCWGAACVTLTTHLPFQASCLEQALPVLVEKASPGSATLMARVHPRLGHFFDGALFPRGCSFQSTHLPHPRSRPPQFLGVGELSAANPGGRLGASRSTVTHPLMWDEGDILNLSYPSESGTCGFQNQDDTGFPKRGGEARKKC